MPRGLTLAVALLVYASAHVFAQTPIEAPAPAPEPLGGVQISGQLFLAFENVSTDDIEAAHFVVNRAYINFKKDVTEAISIRVTPDITIDQDGDGEGDVEMRIKYCYVKADIPEIPVLDEAFVELGLAPRPLLQFEQAINRYRVRGNMFLERSNVTNTTGFGGSFNALIGGTMDDSYKKDVNKKHAGRYGSLSVGVYNGGGYHALEQNINKTIEARLSVRPLPDIIPGMQFTYAGSFGKGNTPTAPDYEMNVGMATFESSFLRLVGQYYTGMGNYKGKPFITLMEANPDYNGYSAFADINIPTTPFYVFGQYDEFTQVDTDGDVRANTIIAGIAWFWHKNSKLLFDYGVESFDYDDSVAPETAPGDDVRYKVSVEVNF